MTLSPNRNSREQQKFKDINGDTTVNVNLYGDDGVIDSDNPLDVETKLKNNLFSYNSDSVAGASSDTHTYTSSGDTSVRSIVMCSTGSSKYTIAVKGSDVATYFTSPQEKQLTHEFKDAVNLADSETIVITRENNDLSTKSIYTTISYNS